MKAAEDAGARRVRGAGQEAEEGRPWGLIKIGDGTLRPYQGQSPQ